MNIFKAFLHTALLVILQFVVTFGILEFEEFVLERYGITDYEIYPMQLLDIVSMVIAYLIILYLFKIKIKRNTGERKKLDVNIIFNLLIITIGLEFVDRPLFDFSKIIDTIKSVIAEPYTHYERPNTWLTYKGILVLIVAPIFEELFFRRYIFAKLLKKYSLWISIVSSSICFALIHIQSYRSLLPTFIFGVISCFVYNKTKNIIYSILLHFLTNLAWVLSLIYGASFYTWVYGFGFDFRYWLLFIFGMITTLLGLKRIITAN